MTITFSRASVAVRHNLQLLGMIRNIALGGQILALLFFTHVKDIGLPWLVLSIILACYALITAVTWWRTFQAPEISDLEFFFHLLVDINFFTALLYFSGGASNPFVSYYLVPISIAATTLPSRYTWATAGISLVAYSWLLWYYVAIPALAPSGHHAHHDAGENLHMVGMWVNFMISAALITYFVTRMKNTIRAQEQKLVESRELQLQNDQVLAIGSLAAGTAHELGTPLNTLKLVLDDLTEDNITPADIRLLQQQVSQCQTTLQALVKTAEGTIGEPVVTPIRDYFETLFERWLVVRPSITAEIAYPIDSLPVTVSWHPTVAQSITNLLNNAADASPQPIQIQLAWSERQADIIIQDFGKGFHLDNHSTPFSSDKEAGMGLGLLLSQTALQRHGGTVDITPNSNGQGTRTHITMPIDDTDFPIPP